MIWKNPMDEEPQSNKDYIVRFFFKDGSYVDKTDNWRPAYYIWCSQCKNENAGSTRYCEIPEFDSDIPSSSDFIPKW